MKKYIALFLILCFSFIALVGCGESKKPETQSQKIVVGVTAGPHEAIVEKVKQIAAKEGLIVEVVTFNDYIQPNIQLSDKHLDLNSFQHEPYLNKFKTDRKLSLVKIATTVNFPMGIYSQKIKDVTDLKEGDQIGLPNDPTNQARALKLFESAGLITLKEGVGVKAKVSDIVDNPRKLEFVELEAPIILRTLPDLAAAAINTNFIIQAGLSPVKDSIFIEAKDSPWVNIIVCREGEENNPLYKKFIQLYQSDEVKEFIDENFKDSIVSSW